MAERITPARPMPELLRLIAANVRAEDHEDDPFRHAGQEPFAQIFEIAADRWEDPGYRGNQLLDAIGNFARTAEPHLDEVPANPQGESVDHR